VAATYTTQKTNTHAAPGGIRTRDPSNRAAADLLRLSMAIRIGQYSNYPFGVGIFFLILAHPVYKM